jgi:hypothetical protein
MKSIKHIALTTLLTFGSFGAVLYTSCDKDKCKDVVCQNSGTCNDGTCTCPTGIAGVNCETIFRVSYANTYTGNGTDNLGGTYNNFKMVFTASGTDVTKMTLNIKDATGGAVDVPELPIVLSNFSLTNSTFTITSTSYTSGGVTYTYTGSGTISGTVASLSLIETPATGSAVTYTFNNFAK